VVIGVIGAIVIDGVIEAPVLGRVMLPYPPAKVRVGATSSALRMIVFFMIKSGLIT
jgi:hypothetical protein